LINESGADLVPARVFLSGILVNSTRMLREDGVLYRIKPDILQGELLKISEFFHFAFGDQEPFREKVPGLPKAFY
jgi:hypothetical protein